jgi:hypothetical protein
VNRAFGSVGLPPKTTAIIHASFMHNRFARLIAMLAAVQILGGHWLLLQSAAWVGMVMDFSRKDSLPVAIEKAFDGEHPCYLCKSVSKGRGEEQKQQVAKLPTHFEAVLTGQFVLPQPSEAAWNYPTLSRKVSARTLAPPTPPPLAA